MVIFKLGEIIIFFDCCLMLNFYLQMPNHLNQMPFLFCVIPKVLIIGGIVLYAEFSRLSTI